MKQIGKDIKTKIKNPDRINLRRNQIIKGAIEVFTSKGFHNATVREIAEASGLTEGTLYNYIRSKEDIIYIVYDYITNILRNEMEQTISKTKDPKERLKAVVQQTLDTIAEYQDVILFMYKESDSLDKKRLYNILARETEYVESFEKVLREYFKGMKVNETRLRLAADLLPYIPVILTLRRWSLKNRFESIDAIINNLREFILHGVEFIAKE